jgi:hypothetical protein
VAVTFRLLLFHPHAIQQMVGHTQVSPTCTTGRGESRIKRTASALNSCVYRRRVLVVMQFSDCIILAP